MLGKYYQTLAISFVIYVTKRKEFMLLFITVVKTFMHAYI